MALHPQIFTAHHIKKCAKSNVNVNFRPYSTKTEETNYVSNNYHQTAKSFPKLQYFTIFNIAHPIDNTIRQRFSYFAKLKILFSHEHNENLAIFITTYQRALD